MKTASQTYSLPIYARTALIRATTLLFIFNLLAYSAFAYMPMITPWRLLGSFAVLPYGLFVAWYAYAYRDFYQFSQKHVHLFGAAMMYGAVIVAASIVHLGDQPGLNLSKAFGLLCGPLALGIALPAMLTRTDYERLVMIAQRCLGALAIIGLVVQLGPVVSLGGVKMFNLTATTPHQPSGSWSLFAHHTLISRGFQWLPLLSLTTVLNRGLPRSNPLKALAVFDLLAIVASLTYTVISGSRQGPILLAIVGICFCGRLLVKSRWSFRRVIWSVVPGIAAVVLASLALPRIIFGFLEKGFSLSGRLTIWLETWKRLLNDDRLFVGYGLNPGLVNGWFPHNTPLAYLAAFGVLGLLAFLCVVLTALVNLTSHKEMAADDRLDDFHLAATAALLALILQMGIDDFAFLSYSSGFLSFWFLVGFLSKAKTQE